MQNAESAAKSYASERGGEALKLVVGGARLRVLAEKWGVGRLLQPDTVRTLLTQKAVAVDGLASGKTEMQHRLYSSLVEEKP